MAVFIATNVTILSSVPPEASGVAGAVFAVCLQLGGVIGLSIQAGLFTIRPGTFFNEYNVQASFWFAFGWAILSTILVLVFYRHVAAPNSEMAKQMAQKEAEAGSEELSPRGETTIV